MGLCLQLGAERGAASACAVATVGPGWPAPGTAASLARLQPCLQAIRGSCGSHRQRAGKPFNAARNGPASENALSRPGGR